MLSTVGVTDSASDMMVDGILVWLYVWCIDSYMRADWWRSDVTMMRRIGSHDSRFIPMIGKYRRLPSIKGRKSLRHQVLKGCCHILL